MGKSSVGKIISVEVIAIAHSEPTLHHRQAQDAKLAIGQLLCSFYDLVRHLRADRVIESEIGHKIRHVGEFFSSGSR